MDTQYFKIDAAIGFAPSAGDALATMEVGLNSAAGANL
jgi:hypothetical protein